MHETAVSTRPERLRLSALFFVHAQANGLWFMAMSNVLRAHGFERIVPYTIACYAIAAMISPLVLGSLADQHLPANRLLRWLAVGTGIFLAFTMLAVERAWSAASVLALLQIHALCSAPMWGLSTSVVLARLREPEREFGPIRAWATIGWMSAGPLTSFVLVADSSTRAGFAASLIWLAVAAFTYTLPEVPPLGRGTAHSWRDVLGFRALALLGHRDHRVVFVTAALFCVPLAAFYPFTPLHLGDLGVVGTTAAMSLGQITETITMFGLAALFGRFRLKWIFLTGIGFGIARYVIFALDTKTALLAGIALHGFCYTLFFITAQLYLEKRIDPQLRARAQSLLTLMSGGLGTLIGAIASGWWRDACRVGNATNWPQFWLGMAGAIGVVFVFFAVSYRGLAAMNTDSPQM
ncbi:MAG TPA: MFS transporter [Chthoniobacteraceae bacterium]|jgi:MFS family permease|nr:MFS transporter [Chthoniobacteraceae bacterium]